MDIIPPRPVQLYSVKEVVPTKVTDGVLQHNLLPQQFLQASVVSGGEHQVVLDLGQQMLTATTEQPLASGQKLNLQVVATQPQLKLQIVANSDPVLLRLVNLFDHKTALGSQLTQLLQAQYSAPGATGTAKPNFAMPVADTAGATLPGNNAATSPQLPSTLAPTVNLHSAKVAEPFANQLADQMGLDSPLASASGAEKHLNSQMVPKSVPVVGAGTVAVPAVGAETVGKLLANPALNELAPAGELLTPVLSGSAAVNATAQSVSASQWQQLEQLATTLLTGMDNADGRFMHNLARALGLDFEFLSAQDKLAQFEPGVKGLLTAVQDDSAASSTVRQHATSINSQLELLQLCRLHLAQEGVLFLPLPFDFLQQGYALFERQAPPEDGGADGNGAENYLVSLNMNLTSLGAMQVNLLFEQQALYVRILCADDEAVHAVHEHVAELRRSLQNYNVSSVRVTTGAQDPALTLLRRLQPAAKVSERSSLFDARV